MQSLVRQNYLIVTWNGLMFDFKVLARYASNPKVVINLAFEHHIDMMFEVFCRKGFMLGLDAACKGQGLSGKGDIHGDLAPHLWAEEAQGLIDAGREDLAIFPPVERRRMCLDYVSSDTRITADLYSRLRNTGILHWTAHSGRHNSVLYRGLSVRQCLSIEHPNTSWMSNPLPREDFFEWTQKYGVKLV